MRSARLGDDGGRLRTLPRRPSQKTWCHAVRRRQQRQASGHRRLATARGRLRHAVSVPRQVRRAARGCVARAAARAQVPTRCRTVGSPSRRGRSAVCSSWAASCGDDLLLGRSVSSPALAPPPDTSTMRAGRRLQLRRRNARASEIWSRSSYRAEHLVDLWSTSPRRRSRQANACMTWPLSHQLIAACVSWCLAQALGIGILVIQRSTAHRPGR